MGVVDVHVKRLAGVDRLEPAGNRSRRREPSGDTCRFEPQHARRDRSRQRVHQVEPSAERHAKLDAFPGAARPLGLHFDAVDEIERARVPRDRELLGEASPPRVVDVDHGRRAPLLGEQARLGREVVVERVVEVEVVTAQVREHADAKPGAVDAMLCERVRRHLHRDGGGADVAQPRELRLQV